MGPVQKIAEIFHKDEPRSQIKLFRVNAGFFRSFLSKETLRIMYPTRVYLRSKGTTVGSDLITVKKKLIRSWILLKNAPLVFNGMIRHLKRVLISPT